MTNLKTTSLVLLSAVLAVTGAPGSSTSLRSSSTGTTGRNLNAAGWCGGWCDHGSRWVYWQHCDCEGGWEGKCCDVRTPCRADSDNRCDVDRLEERSFKCKDVTADAPLIVDLEQNLPENIRGIFWLRDQGDSSAIVSFGKEGMSKDGGGLNQGKLSSGEDSIRIRVGGDRVWGFHDTTSGWRIVEGLDLVYNFRFDSITNPTKAEIIPQALQIGFINLWAGGISLDGFATKLLRFSMHLMTEEDPDRPAKYAGIPMWDRDSVIFGSAATEAPAKYQLVQIIDGNGERTAAFDDWVSYCESDETGGNPGVMYYNEAV